MNIFESLKDKLFNFDKDKPVIKKFFNICKKIRKISFSHLKENEFQQKTEEFRSLLKNKSSSIDDILPETFALVLEACYRKLGIKHYDVQIVGGLGLHNNFIVEMATGEGKTYISIFPAYIRSLLEKHVHIITVNDYLARRDFEKMLPVYKLLGVSLGCVFNGQSRHDKQSAYRSDVVYLTCNEAGFDYLRDRTCLDKEDIVQTRSLGMAIIDEADSVLIDEAVTPLVLSLAEDSQMGATNIKLFDNIAKNMQSEVHFNVDEKKKLISIKDQGYEFVENNLIGLKVLVDRKDLYFGKNLVLLEYLNNALLAHYLYKKDYDYVVNNKLIYLVSDKTGRIQHGRKMSHGLHQAIEAKEQVNITKEFSRTAYITLQNFFLLYEQLSGMTGTAKTEEVELEEIYNLKTITIPTNKPCRRKSYKDALFTNKDQKYKQIVNLIESRKLLGQPFLIGTASIDTSEEISDFLKKSNISHRVLNAKNHQQEAEIIATAGEPGAITIATNMAGRGTDIVLGGHPSSDGWSYKNKQVIESGGLFVIGTERNFSRRIDNQLIGRCARQGDVGESKFFISLEDRLLRIFGGTTKFIDAYRQQEAQINLPFITYFIQSAQKKVEELSFKRRKYDLDYDNVISYQRSIFYSLRDKILLCQDDKYDQYVLEIIKKSARYCQLKVKPQEVDQTSYKKAALDCLNIELKDKNLNSTNFCSAIFNHLNDVRNSTCYTYSKSRYLGIERRLILFIMQSNWQDHINDIDNIKRATMLSGYAQIDPKTEFKRQLHFAFVSMMENMFLDIVIKINNINKQMCLV